MNREELRSKWENYWYYYKVHTIAGIFIAIVIIYAVIGAVGHKDSVLNVILVGNSIDDNVRASMQSEATNMFVNDSRKEISISFLSKNKNVNDTMNQAVAQKILTMFAAKDLDILVLDKDDFKEYAVSGAFKRIDEIPGINSQLLKTVNAIEKDGDGQEHMYGIDMSDNFALSKMGYDTKDKVLGIAANTTRMELAVKFLKWIMNI